MRGQPKKGATNRQKTVLASHNLVGRLVKAWKHPIHKLRSRLGRVVAVDPVRRKVYVKLGSLRTAHRIGEKVDWCERLSPETCAIRIGSTMHSLGEWFTHEKRARALSQPNGALPTAG